ncbi:MAG: putative DNA binding domain-containing protein [Nitrospirae bacterium]|nr:putative DNA binding domain-containing protein [Nitrospirota bacterium]
MTQTVPPQAHPPFDDTFIDDLLQWEESSQFECKRLAGKLTSALESVVALANSEGGIIALGFEDPDKAKGRARVYGIQENPTNWDELRRQLQSRITEPNLLPCSPVEIGCTLRDGTKGSVVFLKIEKSNRIHSIVDDGTWVRLDKGNKELTANEINDLSFARGTISVEAQLEPIDVELLDTDYWKQYAQHRRLTRPIAEALRHIGLARPDAQGRLRPTRAAVLLFAEEPSGLLSGKAAVRVFHYRGNRVQTDPHTNLLKPPRTISGPIIRQIQDTTDYVVSELASGVQMGPLGFEIVQSYPVRVIKEAITNALIHRDYRLPADVHIRIFSDRIEVESPGLLAGPVTAANIGTIGTHTRNPVLVNHLREFPSPPNLDAGEGVRMMFGTMQAVGLYPPLYQTRPQVQREAVIVFLLNDHRPTAWEQVSRHIDQHGSIGNTEVRKAMETDDVLTASKQIKKWLEQGLLVILNPAAGTRARRYSKPNMPPPIQLFSTLEGKQRRGKA